MKCNSSKGNRYINKVTDKEIQFYAFVLNQSLNFHLYLILHERKKQQQANSLIMVPGLNKMVPLFN